MHGKFVRPMLLWTVLSGAAVTAADPPQQQDLVAAAGRFKTAIELAKLDLIPAFTAAKESIRKSRALNPEGRTQALKELEDIQALFEQDGTLTDIPSLKRGTLKYQRAYEQATAQLDGVFKEFIADRSNSGDGAAADKARQWRNELVIGPGHELTGKWQLLSGRGSHGYEEWYAISKSYGRWSMERVFIDEKGVVAGSTFGTDFRYVGGALTFQEHYRKKPVDSWDDNCTVSIMLAAGSSDRAENRYQTPGGLTGIHALVRVP